VELNHTFTVPAGIDATWAHFQDIESVAGCFPGATVSSVEGDTFKGSAKVKLGPIALVYNGSGTFLEKDEAAKRFVVEAKGKDKRGNGTAGATVTATMTSEGESSTKVDVATDLAITGRPAQFGRGVIQDVSDKLLQQFVTCLQEQVGAATAPAEEPAPVEEPATVEEPAWVEEPASVEAAAAAEAPASTPTPPTSPMPPAAGTNDDALDLGATVLPILVRAYWKPALGALAVLALLIAIFRRRR